MADPPPSADHADSSPSVGSIPDTFTVAQLCDRVGGALGAAFPDEVWVQGAISSLTRSANGHVYFDLVDPADQVGRSNAAVLPVALFASSRHLVNRILRRAGGIRMHDGIEIRVRGQVTYYPPQGRVQLVMSLIDPQFTLGQMAAARQQLIDKLAAEGLLERNAGLTFPALPLRVGLVTSDQSAAYHDFVDELTASGFPFAITLIDSRVQGPEAISTLTGALRAVGTGEIPVDVVVVARGGGARSDLVAFDHEEVARAIALCPVPVIVGVGHETDRSVADEVAHRSTKTPTASARLLIDAVARFEARVDQAARRLHGITELHLDRARGRLLNGAARLITMARRTVEDHRLELRHATYRLSHSPSRALDRAHHRLTVAATRLGALDPANALGRGWTMTYVVEPDGAGGQTRVLLRNPAQVTVGSLLHTVTANGTVDSTVDGTVDSTVDSTAQTEEEKT